MLLKIYICIWLKVHVIQYTVCIFKMYAYTCMHVCVHPNICLIMVHFFVSCMCLWMLMGIWDMFFPLRLIKLCLFWVVLAFWVSRRTIFSVMWHVVVVAGLAALSSSHSQVFCVNSMKSAFLINGWSSWLVFLYGKTFKSEKIFSTLLRVLYRKTFKWSKFG